MRSATRVWPSLPAPACRRRRSRTPPANWPTSVYPTPSFGALPLSSCDDRRQRRRNQPKTAVRPPVASPITNKSGDSPPLYASRTQSKRRARGWACFCPRSEPAVSHGQTGSIEAAAISPIRQRGHGDTRCRRGQTPRPGAPRTWLVRLPKESRVARRRLLTTDLPSSRLADDWPPPNGPASHRGSRPRFHLKGIHAHGTLCPRGLTPKEE
jgi:hypothetical protein